VVPGAKGFRFNAGRNRHDDASDTNGSDWNQACTRPAALKSRAARRIAFEPSLLGHISARRGGK